MNKKIIVLLIFTIFLFGKVNSQVNDAGMWVNISIQKKISQSWSAELAHCSRFNENISELGSIVNEIGVNYKLNKSSKISLFYRINLQQQLDNLYIPVSRFYVDYSYKHKQGSLVWTMRLRFHHQQKGTYFIDFDGKSKYAVRPKIALKYPLGKLTPYLSGEAYLPVFSNKYKPIDKLRVEVGIDYEFNNSHSIEVAYFVQREFFENNRRTDFVLSLGYAFSF